MCGESKDNGSRRELRRTSVDPSLPAKDFALLSTGDSLIPNKSVLSAPPSGVTDSVATTFYLALVLGMVAFAAAVFSGSPHGTAPTAASWITWTCALAAATLMLAGAARIGLNPTRPQSPTIEDIEKAARKHPGACELGEANLDDRSVELLARTHDAVDAVTGSRVFREGRIDQATFRNALAEQEWRIVKALRVLTDLSRKHLIAASVLSVSDPDVAKAVGELSEAEREAEEHIRRQVASLEHLTAVIGHADRDLARSEAHAILGRLADERLDLIASTTATVGQGNKIMGGLLRDVQAVRHVLRHI
jgi:hypothetical protein